jgi:hypothetical protein
MRIGDGCASGLVADGDAQLSRVINAEALEGDRPLAERVVEAVGEIVDGERRLEPERARGMLGRVPPLAGGSEPKLEALARPPEAEEGGAPSG